ncbi:hypothetical protein Cycma_3534 [Cyclobacterium marinum DSM 745]|uniref:Uncharacterized protein n=1 Tax=Cyclobacterium marinum (strain ATCC 25205 / DSM 745 / LMG 13164 / NCIMB 1802) TaxID=880070 RepID=G0IYS1_CYCMS|nr:hypothetical protein Cycma_3534 [Cyclobacterium marinum DSM 745]
MVLTILGDEIASKSATPCCKHSVAMLKSPNTTLPLNTGQASPLTIARTRKITGCWQLSIEPILLLIFYYRFYKDLGQRF